MPTLKHPLIACALLLGACSSAPPPKPAAPLPTPAPIATAPASRAPLFVEYVTIHEVWVRKVMPAEPAAVHTWAAQPDVGLAGDVFWHILVKGSKSDADVVLARLKKGESFERLAREKSDDPGSKDHGGYYPESSVKDFVPPVRDAYAKLKSGQFTQTVVKSDFGYHVIRKAPLGADELERQYRDAKAPELTKALAKDLSARFHGAASSRAAIADAVTAVLGDSATSDEHRPSAATVERDDVKATRLPDAAKSAVERFADRARPGDVLEDPIAVQGEQIVARVAPGPS